MSTCTVYKKLKHDFDFYLNRLSKIFSIRQSDRIICSITISFLSKDAPIRMSSCVTSPLEKNYKKQAQMFHQNHSLAL